MKKIFFTLIWIGVAVSRVQASLLLNEFYASPSSGEDEWVEIYNDAAGPISVAGWQIAELAKDTIANPETISDDFIIPAHGFLRIVPSKLTLNNAGDTIYLLDPDGSIADIVAYPKLTANQSYARIPDGSDNWEKTTPTPGLTNNPAADAAAIQTHDPAASSSATLDPSTITAGGTTTPLTASPGPTVTSSSKDSAASTTLTSASPSPSPVAQAGSATLPSPTPAPVAAAPSHDDDSWKDQVNFNLPYLGTADIASRQTPSVLGTATTIPQAATASARLLSVRIPPGPLIGLIITGAWCLGIMLWWGWLEYAGGRDWLRQREPIDEF